MASTFITDTLLPDPLSFIVVSLVVAAASVSAQLANPLNYWCGTTGDFTVNGTFQNNLNALVVSIESNTSISYGFYNSSLGQSPDTVNAIALCRGDLNPTDCRACITEAAQNLTMLCPTQKETITWYEKCMVRYSNLTIYGVMNPIGFAMNTSSVVLVSSNIADQFNRTLHGLLGNLTERAAGGDSMRKFAVGNTTNPRIYGLAQCTPDLSEINCRDCLSFVIGNVSGSVDGGVSAAPSCIVRYQTYPFYDDLSTIDDASPPSPRGSSSNRVRTALIIILSVVAVSLLVVGMFIWKVMKSKKGVEISTVGEIRTAESLQYDLQTLRDATNNFAEENKLGQGGFGAVYKGRLANGEDIAVKRLGRFSGQGETEFKNEVVLVAALQHRNLVRLLGFCLSGSEMILVYEYVPNASLDHFIFDPTKSQQLCWERRYMIIKGIGRGLVYLHEDSRLRIIHRDLKASNVLLDADMNPKISDFGMARLFKVDQNQDETSRIVGTFSYMAPEYKLYGKLSVKTDVFSFGVLVLEIISGQKNSWGGHMAATTSEEDLLSRAWRSWREETVVPKLIDPTLKEEAGSMAEILRCFHVALLCVQQNAAERPSMASVMMMLSNNSSVALPVPSQPIIYSFNSQDESTTNSSSTTSYHI